MKSFLMSASAAIVVLLTLFSCAKPEAYYTWIENVSFREAPGLDSKVITQLDKGEKVIYYGEKSDILTMINIRCIDFNTNWVKVKRDADDTYGWVYAATIRKEPVSAENHWRIIVFYEPKNPDTESKAKNQEWLKLKMDAKANVNQNTVYIVDVKEGMEKCVKIGDSKYPAYAFDLTEYMKPTLGYVSNKYGYFLIENNKKPLFLLPEKYAFTEIVLEATNYFSFDIGK